MAQVVYVIVGVILAGTFCRRVSVIG